MQNLVRNLAQEQNGLTFNTVEVVEAAYFEASETPESLLKFFSPHAHSAKSEYESRKLQQKCHKLWKETIFKQHMDLQRNKLKLQERVAKLRNNSNFNVTF